MLRDVHSNDSSWGHKHLHRVLSFPPWVPIAEIIPTHEVPNYSTNCQKPSAFFEMCEGETLENPNANGIRWSWRKKWLLNFEWSQRRTHGRIFLRKSPHYRNSPLVTEQWSQRRVIQIRSFSLIKKFEGIIHSHGSNSEWYNRINGEKRPFFSLRGKPDFFVGRSFGF